MMRVWNLALFIMLLPFLWVLWRLPGRCPYYRNTFRADMKEIAEVWA